MKKNYFLLPVLLNLLAVGIYAQCSFNDVYYGFASAPVAVGTQVTIGPCIYGGEYLLLNNMIAGNTYRIETCGDASFDTQLTIFPQFSSSPVAYNDDYCGLQSSIDFTPPVTGNYRIQVNEFNCAPDVNGVCMTLKATLIAEGNFYMTNGTVNTCSGNFYDSGGLGGNYLNSENYTFTICPDNPGDLTEVTFSSFLIEDYFDFLRIYDGSSTGDPLIGTYTSTNSPGTVTSTHASGCLTFWFTSDGSVTQPGWAAEISCVPGGPVILMQNGTVNTCSGTFYDSGGAGDPYSNNEEYILTICPDDPGYFIQVNFTFFATATIFTNWDPLYVFDDETVNYSNQIGTLFFVGNNSPGSLTATNSSGCLTFYFFSDVAFEGDGWEATIGCVLNSPPNAVCQNLTRDADNNCQAIVLASEFNGGSTDPEGQALSYSVSPAGPYSLGTTSVTLTVTDVMGASSTCNATITVENNTTPAIVNCPATNIVVPNDAGQCGAIVNYTTPTGQDNCGPVPLIQTSGLGSGAFFPVGTTTETYEINQGGGASCSFTVTVNDTEAPTLNCVENFTAELNSDGEYILYLGIIVTQLIEDQSDNCGLVTGQAGIGVSRYFFDCSDVGQMTTVTILNNDINGNQTPCNVNFIVTDPGGFCNEPPVAVCKNLELNADSNCEADVAASAFDGGSTDPDGDPLTFSVSPEGPYPLGMTSVTLTVEDGNGGVSTCAATVTVTDVTPPTIGVNNSAFVNPGSVAIPGNFNSELGCAGDWQPDCPNIELVYDAGDLVWQGTFNIPAGYWEYKAAIDDSWDENYGANATYFGPNIGLGLGAATNVKFYYDPQSHWITDNVNSLIVTAAGDFQSEIG